MLLKLLLLLFKLGLYYITRILKLLLHLDAGVWIGDIIKFWINRVNPCGSRLDLILNNRVLINYRFVARQWIGKTTLTAELKQAQTKTKKKKKTKNPIQNLII